LEASVKLTALLGLVVVGAPVAATCASAAANAGSPVTPTSSMQSSSNGSERTPRAVQIASACALADAESDATV
jgi:hypothetical protein